MRPAGILAAATDSAQRSAIPLGTQTESLCSGARVAQRGDVYSETMPELTEFFAEPISLTPGFSRVAQRTLL